MLRDVAALSHRKEEALPLRSIRRWVRVMAAQATALLEVHELAKLESVPVLRKPPGNHPELAAKALSGIRAGL
jgi:hypothetical protein